MAKLLNARRSSRAASHSSRLALATGWIIVVAWALHWEAFQRGSPAIRSLSMRSTYLLLTVAMLVVSAQGAATETPAATSPARLVVGTRHVPPFAIRGPDGAWRGISIDLWREVAEDLQLQYEYREMDLPQTLQSLREGSVDVVVAALTVTPQRERDFDFTHSFHTTGLGIAVGAKPRKGWLGGVSRLFSWAFLRVVGSLGGLLLLVGAVVWLVERRKNPQQFGGHWIKGIGAGFWWSAVTMTTVGYGDKAPRTWAGRLMAIVWMFAAIILISTFTATIAASLTLSELETPSYTVEDLPRIRVASVKGSTSAEYLTDHRIAFGGYSDVGTALKATAQGQVDAVVYDAPILRYLISTEMPEKLTVLPRKLERQDYAFGLPSGSPLREPLNRAVIERIRRPDWQDVLFRYLGPQ
jgi:polar amino acid transport system substrate-binding protein